MKTSELAYPVIAICEEGAVLEVRPDEDTLTTATSQELRRGWFDSMTIVDSDGRAVRVREAEFVSGKGRLWGYTARMDRIIRIRVVLDDEVSDMSLEDLKARVIGSQEISGSSMDPEYAEQVLKELAAARTVRELIERFQPQMDVRQYYADASEWPAVSTLRALLRRR